MKFKGIIIGVICFLFVSSLKAQTNKYHPFPDSNAVWCDATSWSSASHRSIAITGDTVVSGKTYHKLVSNSLFFEQGPYPGDVDYQDTTSATSSYCGAIRQDTALRQVYFLSPSATNEFVLYDFSLHVGDTLGNFSNIIGATSYATITSIDSVLIGTSYRKRWVVNQSGAVLNGYIIEGMGSTSGLYDDLNNEAYPNAPIDYLTCFSQNNIEYYPYYSTTDSCQQIRITGIKTINTQHSIFQIYPNPASSSLQVAYTGNSAIKEITLIDVLGNEVAVQTLRQAQGSTYTIDVSGLANGVYFLNLKTSEGLLTKKLVLQH